MAAVKDDSGADPVMNQQLAKVMSQAKEMNVPKELIDRNIKRASDGKQADFVELVDRRLWPRWCWDCDQRSPHRQRQPSSCVETELLSIRVEENG